MGWCVVLLASCESAPDTLLVEATRVGPSAASVVVTATKGDGTIGSGSVSLSSTAGALLEETLPLDAFGTAKTALSCDAAVDPACAERITIAATWNDLEASDFVTLTGAGGGSPGPTGGGSGSTGGGGTGVVRRVTNQCAPNATPGRNLTCCTEFLCPMTVVPPGATVSIPFRTEDGGVRLDIEVTWAAPTSSGTADECRASRPLLTTPDGGTLVYLCSNFSSSPTGQWNAHASGGCQSGSLAHYCDDFFNTSAVVWVHTLRSADTWSGSEWWAQANDETYVFPMFK